MPREVPLPAGMALLPELPAPDVPLLPLVAGAAPVVAAGAWAFFLACFLCFFVVVLTLGAGAGGVVVVVVVVAVSVVDAVPLAPDC